MPKAACAAFLDEMLREEGLVLARGLKVVRRQRHRQHGHAGVHACTHQPVDHGAGDKVVTIYTTVHHQRGTDDGIIAARRCQIARHQRHFKRARHVDHVDLGAGNNFGKPVQRAVDDIGVPAGLDISNAGVCHM